MKLFDCIRGLYTKDPAIYDACKVGKFEFNNVALVSTLAKDFDNQRWLALLTNSYLYMETVDLVAVLWLLIPSKQKVPYLVATAKPVMDSEEVEYRKKCMKVLNWSSNDMKHSDEVIHWFYTNNKGYFEDV